MTFILGYQFGFVTALVTLALCQKFIKKKVRK
jgi:hypothetical protein